MAPRCPQKPPGPRQGHIKTETRQSITLQAAPRTSPRLFLWLPSQALAVMVHYNKSYGPCHVCWRSQPRTWFRCNICVVWMGYHCRKKNHVDARVWLEDDPRFAEGEVSLHCYIWTSTVKNIKKRADLCRWCCEHRILARSNPNDT